MLVDAGGGNVLDSDPVLGGRFRDLAEGSRQ